MTQAGLAAYPGLECGSTHLKCVASRRRFVILVALQGEGRNADIKVGTISSFDAKRSPKTTIIKTLSEKS